jgi:hypothetical protein
MARLGHVRPLDSTHGVTAQSCFSFFIVFFTGLHLDPFRLRLGKAPFRPMAEGEQEQVVAANA